MDNQEEFWISQFGDEYTDRNNDFLIKNNINLFEKILKKININSLFEIGCNRGLNLEAINNINKDISLYGLEINKKAYDIIKEKKICKECFNISINDFNISEKYDLVLTKGVLIHLNPDKLDSIYQKMYDLSNKYILIAEYYSRDVREILYRGHSNKLFKRDFCGEIMDKFKDLKLIDYGFVYYRDSKNPLDDITWFLLEKY
jgi:pseudaminic acid biosynthesis-associated methylase